MSQSSKSNEPVVAILIPCHNEEMTIGKVVADFRSALPAATVYVYDNNSSDGTAEQASAAGATVRAEHLQGKGHVVRRMFADIDADIYVLVDGDDTYDASAAPTLVRTLLEERLDMVTGARVTDWSLYRKGHRFGNKLLTGTVGMIFGKRTEDMLSGYRVFSRRFVKSFPSLAEGFEIETELVVHALEMRMPIGEVETAYGDRPEGSVSKLSTIGDGFRILRTIGRLVKEERPLPLFGVIAAVSALVSIVLAIPLVVTYSETGLVPRLPTAVLATGLMLTAFSSLICGLILDSVTRSRREMKQLAYLSVPALSVDTGALEAALSSSGEGPRGVQAGETISEMASTERIEADPSP